MALSDILQAIITEADRQIAELQSAHKRRMKELTASHEKEYFDTLKHIDRQKNDRMRQMRSRVEGHAHMVVRHAILRKKRELLDQCYARVCTAVAEMPRAQLEAFYDRCLDRVSGSGEIQPTKAAEEILRKLIAKRDGLTLGSVTPGSGGFRFIGATEDHDYTFEFLVHDLLRPAMELSTASKLFAA
jgi:vacuolar-type H+-ATPase subunit E/Vma4